MTAALLAGDERVFLGVVAMHHPVLVRLARTQLRDPQDVKDTMDATWRAFLEQLDDVEDSDARPARLRLLLLLLERLQLPTAHRGPAGDCLQALPADEAEVLLLRDVAGLDREDVGRVLGLDDVRQDERLARARRRLSVPCG